ncbi:MAG: hypothetical protein V3U19_01565 [Thermodesulfobacteriota bacterium]
MRKAIITMSVVLGLVLGGLFPLLAFVYLEPDEIACTNDRVEKEVSKGTCISYEA